MTVPTSLPSASATNRTAEASPRSFITSSRVSVGLGVASASCQSAKTCGASSGLAGRMAAASAIAYTRNFGSRMSRSQSPTRLTPSAVSASAAPGKAASHQAM